MKHTSSAKPRNYLWHKIVIIIIGLVLSVVLHELFHIAVHWGEIQSISFFQGSSIAEVVVLQHSDSDLEGEEIAAYLITLLVMMLTVMAIYKINDATDTRTVRQILSEGNTDLRGMRTSEFLKLANKTDLAPPESNAWPRSGKLK